MVHQHFTNAIVVGFEVNFHTETSSNRKPEAMCKNRLLLKMAKRKSCCRHSHCLGCSRSMLGIKPNLSAMKKKHKRYPFQCSPSQHQTCFNSHANLKQNTPNSQQNHPHTFPINRWMCSIIEPHWKRPQTHYEHLS